MDVHLLVYDLSQGLARQMSQGLLGFQLDAIYHTSIQLSGREYVYDGNIVAIRPGSSHLGQPMQRLHLGTTECRRLSATLSCGQDEWFLTLEQSSADGCDRGIPGLAAGDLHRCGMLTPSANQVRGLTSPGIRLVAAQLQQLFQRLCHLSSGQGHSRPHHQHAAGCAVRLRRSAPRQPP